MLCIYRKRIELDGPHIDFHGAKESTTDLGNKIVRGRIPGGVATLWNRFVKIIRLNVNWP